jgi:hypothetical protein
VVDTEVRPPAQDGTAQEDSRPARRTPVSRRSVRVLALQVASLWVITVLAYVLHAAAVLPVAILVATAGLLRGGRTLLDRLMLATALLLGATCAAGLVFAVWPWGLHPVPVAGLAFTALILLSRLTGRRLVLPRPGLADLLSAGAALAMAGLVTVPLRRGGAADRLGLLLTGEDMARHTAIFDGIRHLGGYLFVDWHAGLAYAHPGMIAYPQGSHLTAALLDGFLRSSADRYGTGLDALNHYLVFVVAGYAFFTLAMVWAAQWLAGASLTPGRRVVLVAAVTLACAVTELMSLVVMGYPSEVMGLAETVLLVALLARPIARTGQQLVLLAALVVAIGFSYYLFLPVAGLAALIWLVRNRSRVRRHRVVLALAVAAGAVAAVPIVLGLTVGQQATALLANGHLHPGRDLLVALGLVVLAGLIGRRARRSRIWRSYAWCLGAAVVLAAGLLVGQPLAGVTNGYYASKSLHLLLAVLVLGVGSLALRLPRPAPGRSPALRDAVPGALVAAALAVVSLAPWHDAPIHTVKDTTWARVWFFGEWRNNAVAGPVIREYRARAGAPPVPTFLVTDDGFSTYTGTLFLATLERTTTAVAPALYQGLSFNSPDLLDRMVVKVAGPVRIVAGTDAALARARQVQQRHPELPIEVVRSIR